jgi:lipopolysaccharide transport system permease protein
MTSPALANELTVLWRLRGLLAVLTRRELTARFAGSAGGLLWVWLPPLLTVAAYYLLFDVVFGMRLGSGAPTARVGTYLIAGMLAWMAFVDAVQRGMNSLLEAGGTLQKNALPPGLFPARAALASGMVFAPLLLLLIALYGGSHRFGWGVAAVPLLIALQTALSFLLAYLLAIMTAALRDVAQVAQVALSLGVFLSPVLYPATLFPERWRWLLWLNPMTGPVLGYQSALLQGQWPGWRVWAAILLWLALLALLLSVALRRSRDELVDWL